MIVDLFITISLFSVVGLCAYGMYKLIPDSVVEKIGEKLF